MTTDGAEGAGPRPAGFPSVPGPPERGGVPWSWLDAVAVFLLVIVFGAVLGQVLATALPPRLAQAASFPALLALLALVTLVYVRIRYPGQVARLFGPGSFTARNVLVGAAHGVAAFLVINIGLGLVLHLLAELLGLEPPVIQETIRDAVRDPEFAPLVLLSIVAVAPFAEELFFRGMLFQALRQRLGPWPGIGVSAVVFGLAHLEGNNLEGSLYALLVLALFGLYLAWAFHRQQHLSVPVTMHAVFNLLAVGGIVLGIG